MIYLDAHAFMSEEACQVLLSALEELERLRLVRIVCTRLDEGSERSIGRSPCQRSKHAGLDTGCLKTPLLGSTAVLEAMRLLRKFEQRLPQHRCIGRRGGSRSGRGGCRLRRSVADNDGCIA